MKINTIFFAIAIAIVVILCDYNAAHAQAIIQRNIVKNQPLENDYILFEDEDDEVYFIELPDRYKNFNQLMLKVNKGLDTVIIKPIATQYRRIVPRYVTKRIFLLFQNLQEPLYFINSTLMLEPHNMLNSLWRFVINSTVGIAGMYDVASQMGLDRNVFTFEDFLNKIGFEPGNYLVLPLIGPTNIRGAIGFAADVALHPLTYMLEGGDIYLYRGTNIISTRNEYFEEINDLLYETDNTYTLMKSIYEQQLARGD